MEVSRYNQGCLFVLFHISVVYYAVANVRRTLYSMLC